MPKFADPLLEGHGGRPSSDVAPTKSGQVERGFPKLDPRDRLSFSMRRLTPFSAILIGGGIAGALDITYAIGFSALRGAPPIRLLQSVASGLLGAPAFEGGMPTAALGLALHFWIALLWAAIFYLASKAIPFLNRHPVVAGLFYGFLIYAVMNLVVLPISAFPGKVSFPLIVLVTGILVHMFCIGLPISLAVRRTLPEKA